MRGLVFWWGVVTALGAAVAGAYEVGQGLPKEHRAEASGIVEATPGRIWGMLTETLAQNEWRTGVRGMQNQSWEWSNGMTCWAERRVWGPVPLCAVEETPERRRVVATHEWVPMPYRATWTYSLEPVASGTRVTITEESAIDPPLWRFYGRYVLRGRTDVAQQLRDLQAEGLRRR